MNQALVGIEVISMVDRIVDLEARNEALTNKNKLLTAKETVNDEKSYIQKQRMASLEDLHAQVTEELQRSKVDQKETEKNLHEMLQSTQVKDDEIQQQTELVEKITALNEELRQTFSEERKATDVERDSLDHTIDSI